MPRLLRREAAANAALDDLASMQDRVLSRDQLLSHGWTHDHVAAEVAGRRWAAFGSRAVVLHRGPLTSRQRRWTAIINGGPSVALAGLTAAKELGLTGFETDVVHVVVPKDAWVPRPQRGVKVHISRRFMLTDRHPARVLPTVRIERALIDAAAWSRPARRAAAIVIAGVQQRLTQPDRLRAELLGAGMVRHRRLLFGVIDDVEGGPHALAELDFRRLCRRYQLGAPQQQHRRRDAAGRVRYLDARFTRADGRVLNVEIDGAAHYGVLDAWSDMDRDIALLATGEPTVRVPSAILRSDPAGVVARLRVLLTAPW
ncbi:MAG TPA: hypothetical protein VE287_06590 [Actinopolymorphaceae bacterium]|nr:hypothetical protein [Actinopolymorphaceae bacterium]